MKKSSEKKKMSRNSIILIIVGIILVLWVASSYNGLVKLDEGVNGAWGNVQSAYQRRLDLIPNIIASVKGSAEFESEMQTKIASLRSGIGSATTPAEIDLMGQKINTAISLVYENYPQIKSTEGFRTLEVSLEGTENRIKTERDLYNAAVKAYNIKVRKVPSNIVAGIFNFDIKDMFKADEGAEKAPSVKEILAE
ncbi:LemA family protein [Candidatus Woesearchaeota archaeon]|nr:LemA family protein [Candidatus Woesearchaeota archaeon]